LTHNPPVGLEGIIQTSDITKSWDDYKQKDQSPYVIQTYGYGDGGGGPVRDHIEITSVINSILGFPQTVISSAREFFQKTSDHSGDIPVWEGELYLEKHRGAYTTHGLIKRENRKCEILLYNAELLSIMSSHWGTGGLSKRYPQTELEKAWKSLLMNQFHDILPGTSIPPVYTEAEQEYQNIRTTLNEIISNNLKNLINLETKNNERQIFTIFNPLNWIRSEYIEFEVNSSAKNFTISDDKNNTLEYQILGESNEKRKILCYVQEIPPLGMMTVTVSPSNAKPSVNESWKIGERTIETPLFKFRLDKRGQFSSLYDKKLKYDILKKGGRGNHLQTFRDTPNQWDAWDIDADFERHKLELFTFKSLSVIEQGPLRVTIRLEHVTPNGSILKQDIRLYHKISKIDFETVVDWHEKQTLLKTAFPLNLSSKKATYEIQFGSLERSTHSSAPEEKAKFEVPMQQWMDLSNSKNGISILNDCKYGGDAQGNTLRLTLIRSPFYPHPLEPWRLNDTRVTDQGLHKFTYSLYSHKGDWREGETVQRAREINNHLIIQQGKPRKALPSIFTITHKSIIIESIKRAEDSKHILVRLYESFGIERSVSFTCGFPVKEIIECDLLENDLHQIKVQRSKWSLKFRPFEIKTLKVLLKK
jgi:alpha-mannosidase